MNHTTQPPIRIMIGCPTYDGKIEAEYSSSIRDVFLSRPVLEGKVRLTLYQNKGDSLVTRSRNTIAAEFLASDCEQLIFIDTDLVFSVDAFFDCINWPHPLSCVAYPIKRMHHQLVINEPYGEKTADGWQRCREAGTGFMSIRREVFERMIDEWGDDLRYTCESSQRERYDFFETTRKKCGDEQGEVTRLLSEDYAFCSKWETLGGEVWINDRHRIQHIGKATFPLDFAAEAARSCKAPRAKGQEGAMANYAARAMSMRMGNIVQVGLSDACFVTAERLREHKSLAKVYAYLPQWEKRVLDLFTEDIFALRLQHCLGVLDPDGSKNAAQIVLYPAQSVPITDELVNTMIHMLEPGGQIVGDGLQYGGHMKTVSDLLPTPIERLSDGIWTWTKPRPAVMHDFSSAA